MKNFLIAKVILKKGTHKYFNLIFNIFISFYLLTETDSPEKEYLIVQEQKFNGEFDKDGDGRLNSAEILSWITPNNE